MIRRALGLVLLALGGAGSGPGVDAAALTPPPLPPRASPVYRGEPRRDTFGGGPPAPRGRLHGEPKRIRGTCGRVRYRKRVRVDGRKLSRVTR